MSSDTLMFLGMVFTAALLLAQSTITPMFGENRAVKKRLKRRLKVVGESGPSVGESFFQQKRLEKLKPWEMRLESMPRMQALTALIDQAGHTVPAYRIVLLSLVLGAVAAAAGYWFTRMPLVALAAGAGGCALPFLKLSRDRKKRLEDFERRFPEAIDIMIRGLRAGHPFSSSLQVASNELDGAVSHELGIVFYDVNYGGDVRSALLNLMARIPSITVTAFVTSVLIQRETGGNLAELLGQLSKTVRARFTFQGKVKSATAEGRMSAWVLTLIPFVLCGMLAVSNPGYLDVLTTDPTGKKLVVAAFGLLLLGILWIRQIIKIDV